MSTTVIEPEQFAEVAATRVRMATVERGWNQKELAMAAGIPQTTVSMRWRGRQAWPLVDLARVARALDVEVTDLLDPAGLRLPRLDSNQQPSGYPFPLVTADHVCPDCGQYVEEPGHRCPVRDRAELWAVAA